MARVIFSVLMFSLLATAPVLAADSQIINLPPGRQAGPAWAPGSVAILPDGRRTIIEEVLPQGRLRTDLGIILTPEGIIDEGPGKGQQIILLDPRSPEKAPIAAPAKPAEPEAAIPDPQAKIQEQAPAPQTPAAELPQTVIEPTAPVIVKPAEPERQYSIAELMPKTQVQEQTPAKQPEPEKQIIPKKEEPQKKAPKKAEPEKEIPKKQEKKPQPPKQAKPKPGEELRIPPEAAKSGNLGFLEGCWQGTRPEYYSKRTIRECFCFGPGGKTGKRRIYDSRGGRQCIGSSRATLSQGGVLNVISSGAVCNDGERWGQAEMVCRNSGPKTPCSWVFRDAQNGRQSYQIPFVRVESCGR